MKKLLWVALVLGFIKASQISAWVEPPKPPEPEKKSLARPVLEKPIFVAWTVESGTRDVLEMSSDAETWVDLPGPYDVRGDEYFTRVPSGRANAFFRVRRVWGTPWVP